MAESNRVSLNSASAILSSSRYETDDPVFLQHRTTLIAIVESKSSNISFRALSTIGSAVKIAIVSTLKRPGKALVTQSFARTRLTKPSEPNSSDSSTCKILNCVLIIKYASWRRQLMLMMD